MNKKALKRIHEKWILRQISLCVNFNVGVPPNKTTFNSIFPQTLYRALKCYLLFIQIMSFHWSHVCFSIKVKLPEFGEKCLIFTTWIWLGNPSPLNAISTFTAVSRRGMGIISTQLFLTAEVKIQLWANYPFLLSLLTMTKIHMNRNQVLRPYFIIFMCLCFEL